MAVSNRKKASRGFDATQALVALVALILGAAGLFVVGLQVGEHLDPARQWLAEGVELPQSPSISAMTRNSVKHTPTDEGFSFFAELDEPAPERRSRGVNLPEGNANDPSINDARDRKIRRLKREPSEQVARKAPTARKAPAERPAPMKTPPPALAIKEAPEVPSREVAPPRELGGADKSIPAMVASQRQPEGGTWSIQIGTYDSLGEATAAMTRLSARGQDPRVSRVLVEGKGEVYRVRVGRYSSRQEAEQARASVGGSVIRF